MVVGKETFQDAQTLVPLLPLLPPPSSPTGTAPNTKTIFGISQGGRQHGQGVPKSRPPLLCDHRAIAQPHHPQPPIIIVIIIADGDGVL